MSKLWLEQVCTVQASTIKEAKFPELQFSCRYVLAITISSYWFSVVQCYHILMRELENSVAQGKPEVHWYYMPRYCSRMSCPLILLTHLARSHPLYALISHIPIEYWILSLISIIDSRYHGFIIVVSKLLSLLKNNEMK